MSELICQTQIILLEVNDTRGLLDWGEIAYFFRKLLRENAILL